MRRPGLSTILILAILASASLAAWAATARFTPPAQPGSIFAVVNFDRSSGANRITTITVDWGSAHRTERVAQPYGNCASASPAGFVLMVRNFALSAPKPFEITTNGTIVRGPYQGEAPPEISHACYRFVKMRIR
jgi:hypothetical protein